MQMKKYLLLAVCVAQVACTSTPERMSYQELNHFKVDCKNRKQQYEFLESQKYSQMERLKLAFQMTSFTGLLSNAYHGTDQDSGDGMAMKHEALIKFSQNQLVEHCAIWDRNQEIRKEREDRLKY
jgi:hypothetical protein